MSRNDLENYLIGVGLRRVRYGVHSWRTSDYTIRVHLAPTEGFACTETQSTPVTNFLEIYNFLKKRV